MYVFCVWTPGVRHTAPARPVPPVHINRHHYTSKHSRKSTVRAAPAQKYPGYNRAQAAAAAEPYGWFYMCSSLRGSSAYARAACFFAGLRGAVLRVRAAVFLSYSLHCVFPGRERNRFFRGVVSLPPPSPPSLPALQACRGALHTGLFFFAVPCGAVLRMRARLVSLQVSAGRGFCACARSAAVCKLCGSGQFTNGYQISRLKNNNLPMAHFTFADGKILFCRLSDMNFADGQRRTCRLQIFSLPSANF